MATIPTVTMNELFDAGVHFGYTTSKWDPRMAPYLYGIRNKTHIINIQQTEALLKTALNKIYETVKNNGKVLFVSTKIQASNLIAEYIEQCGQYYVNHRWLGGMLTNWDTVSKSIKKLDDLEKTLSDEEITSAYTKKEILELTRKRAKLLRSLGGIRNLPEKPDLLVIIDTNREHLAINEAVKLGIPIVAVVDSNSNPDNIQYPIPGNDNAIRAIKLYCELFSKAVLAGVEDALVESGVDLKASTQATTEKQIKDEVTKLKQPKRFSKATESQPVLDANSADVEGTAEVELIEEK